MEGKTYNLIKMLVDDGHPLHNIRLDKRLFHSHSLKTEFTDKGYRNKQTCILCYTKCIAKEKSNEKKEEKKHTRRDRATTKYCLVCGVSLCKYCYKPYHNDKKLTFPSCILNKLGRRVSPRKSNRVNEKRVDEIQSNKKRISKKVEVEDSRKNNNEYQNTITKSKKVRKSITEEVDSSTEKNEKNKVYQSTIRKSKRVRELINSDIKKKTVAQ